MINIHISFIEHQLTLKMCYLILCIEYNRKHCSNLIGVISVRTILKLVLGDVQTLRNAYKGVEGNRV